jgi:hypothetical protein
LSEWELGQSEKAIGSSITKEQTKCLENRGIERHLTNTHGLHQSTASKRSQVKAIRSLETLSSDEVRGYGCLGQEDGAAVMGRVGQTVQRD